MPSMLQTSNLLASFDTLPCVDKMFTINLSASVVGFDFDMGVLYWPADNQIS